MNNPIRALSLRPAPPLNNPELKARLPRIGSDELRDWHPSSSLQRKMKA
jgi:hypothetical protein